MESQKQTTLELVAAHRGQGRRVSEVLSSLGVARSNYYRWKKDAIQNPADRQSCYEVTAEELKQIDEVKGQYPQYRHRRIQGVLQQRGVYLSASVIYGHLKAQGQVEPYQRRAAPWKEPRYALWRFAPMERVPRSSRAARTQRYQVRMLPVGAAARPRNRCRAGRATGPGCPSRQ